MYLGYKYENGFGWESGAPFSFSSWCSGEPNYAVNGAMAAMKGQNSLCWDDFGDADWNKFYYICESES